MHGRAPFVGPCIEGQIQRQIGGRKLTFRLLKQKGRNRHSARGPYRRRLRDQKLFSLQTLGLTRSTSGAGFRRRISRYRGVGSAPARNRQFATPSLFSSGEKDREACDPGLDPRTLANPERSGRRNPGQSFHPGDNTDRLHRAAAKSLIVRSDHGARGGIAPARELPSKRTDGSPIPVAMSMVGMDRAFGEQMIMRILVVSSLALAACGSQTEDVADRRE